MAEPPNISSILAALAAQRPGGTPNQSGYQQPPQNAQQPGGAQGYSGGYQAPNPAHALGSYQLPQPTSSGSVDLSGVKPVSTGQGIAEAIAKARSIAAEKGVSYDSRAAAASRVPDPRLAERGGYRRSRSRSRSPPPARRDNFRDNYNPYRDERREDRRGGGGRDYPRDRSFSPGLRDRRGPGNTFSPPPGRGYGGRSPGRAMGGSADDNVETIMVDSSLVGLIIGRSGENLRRVESETGARVQFVTVADMNGPQRPCKITGSRASREQAKSEIYKIIDENARPGGGAPPMDRSTRAEAVLGSGGHQPALRDGEDSMQIMVPDRTVGLIIGRGGETIRDLQERSGCHVNIVGEQKSVNGLRPVNLIGTQQAAAMAKELIMEIVDSDTKSLASQGQGPPQRDVPRPGGGGGGGGGGGYGGFGGGGMGGGGGERINDSIRVPSDSVGMIIGKGGETIKDMQNTTGCKINVSQTSGPGETDREIGLVGSRDAIEAAKRAIEEKVEVVRSGGRRQPREDPYHDRYSNAQPSYGHAAHGQQQPGQAQSQAAAPTGDADPYAAYGGYQNYYAMWYAAMAQQQQQPGGQPGQGGEQPRPPGTA